MPGGNRSTACTLVPLVYCKFNLGPGRSPETRSMSLDLVDFIQGKLYLDHGERDLQLDECGMRESTEYTCDYHFKKRRRTSCYRSYLSVGISRSFGDGGRAVGDSTLEIWTSMYQVKVSSQQRWAWHQDLMAPVLWSSTHSYSKLDHDPCDLDTFRILRGCIDCANTVRMHM